MNVVFCHIVMGSFEDIFFQGPVLEEKELRKKYPKQKESQVLRASGGSFTIKDTP